MVDSNSTSSKPGLRARFAAFAGAAVCCRHSLLQPWHDVGVCKGSNDSPGGVGEGQVALRGLIGRDSNRGADRDDLGGGVDKGGEGAAYVAEVDEEHRIALVQHLEPAGHQKEI